MEKREWEIIKIILKGILNKELSKNNFNSTEYIYLSFIQREFFECLKLKILFSL